MFSKLLESLDPGKSRWSSSCGSPCSCAGCSGPPPTSWDWSPRSSSLNTMAALNIKRSWWKLHGQFGHLPQHLEVLRGEHDHLCCGVVHRPTFLQLCCRHHLVNFLLPSTTRLRKPRSFSLPLLKWIIMTWILISRLWRGTSVLIWMVRRLRMTCWRSTLEDLMRRKFFSSRGNTVLWLRSVFMRLSSTLWLSSGAGQWSTSSGLTWLLVCKEPIDTSYARSCIEILGLLFTCIVEGYGEEDCFPDFQLIHYCHVLWD